MSTLRSIMEWLLEWTKDVAELRNSYKIHHRDYQ